MEHWTTKEGERIALCDMTLGHLRNVVAHLERKAANNGGCLVEMIPMGVSTGETCGGEVFEGPDDVPLQDSDTYNSVRDEIRRRVLAWEKVQ